MNPVKPQLQHDIKGDATARNQIASRTVNAIRFFPSVEYVFFFSVLYSIIHIVNNHGGSTSERLKQITKG